VADQVMWHDLRPVLDEEVNRLPPKYRVPFVLCYFEGKTNEQAAHILGCPQGTVFSRLAWAREQLRKQLTLCVQKNPGGERPTEFATAGTEHNLIVLKKK